MSDDLNAVASEAMSSSTSESYDKSSSASTDTPGVIADTKPASVTNVEKPVDKTNASPNQLSRRQLAAKRESEQRQQLNSSNNRIAELQRQLQQFEPIKPYLSEIQKAAELKKAEELKNQFTKDPLATNQQLTKQMIEEAIQPFKQQAEQQRVVQESTERLNFIKKFAGSEESFKEATPYMKNILDNLIRTSPEDANRLANAPELLFRIARDMANEQKQFQNKETEVKNQESKAEIAKFNGGVSRPSKTVRTPLTNNKEQIRQNAYDYIKELTGQSR